MTYEQARDALATVVERLETGGTTLDESVQLYKRGEALAARCHELLEGVRAAVSPESEETA